MKLFVGKNCTPCKNVKVWLEDNSIQIEQIVAEDNMEYAKEVGVRALPTLLLEDMTLIKGDEEIINYFKEKNNE